MAYLLVELLQCWCENDLHDNDGLQVVVNLVDMNDNLPVFDKEEYRVTIRENIAPGTKVVQVRPDFKTVFNILVSVRMMIVMIMMMMVLMEHSRHCQSADLIKYS